MDGVTPNRAPLQLPTVTKPNPQEVVPVKSLGMASGRQVHHLEIMLSNPDSESAQLKTEGEDDGTESESEGDDDKMPVEPKLSDRRRNQHSKFSSWLVATLYINAAIKI